MISPYRDQSARNPAGAGGCATVDGLQGTAVDGLQGTAVDGRASTGGWGRGERGRPSLYRLLMRPARAASHAALQTVIVAGCPPVLVADHFRLLPKAFPYDEYGPTECTVWCSVHECGPADSEAATVPIG